MLHRLNKTRAAKEGVVEPSAADLIRPFVAVDPDEPPRYSLHFGTINKVGVNPKSEYSTPLAVCAFPLTPRIFKQFLDVRLPFAQDTAKYLFVLEIEPDARVFYSTERFFDLGVGPEYLDADLSNITASRRLRNPFSEKFFYSTRPSNYDLKKQYFVEGGTAARAAQWGRKLWDMGIDVWVDADDEGILHGNEPSQVMFFNPRSYRVVLAMDNPKTKPEIRFGRNWREQREVRDYDRVRRGDKNLYGADLDGADLSYANLNGADLLHAYLDGANLSYAKLNHAILRGANLFGARLKYAELNGANLYRARLRGEAQLLRAKLRGADLREADLEIAELSGAHLTGAKLQGANLIHAELNRADLRDAKLQGSNLSHAKLFGANLTGADLSGANLTYIYYDDSTRWPEGFTPPPSRHLT